MTDRIATATITGYTNGVGVAPSGDLANVNDGNPATYSVLPAGGAGGPTWPEHGWVADFGSPITIGGIRASFTSDFGPEFHTVLGATYGVADQYGSRIQYWDGGAWVDAPGTLSYDTASPRTLEFTFTSPITTSQLRLEYGGKQSNNLWGGLHLYELQELEVGPAPVACAFHATPTGGSAPLEVAFHDDSTGDPDTWLWDFGDGDTSTDQHPVHVYASPGLYDVTLTASRSSDDDECTETIEAYIGAGDPVAWDAYAAADPNGPILATIQNDGDPVNGATGRAVRIELNGPGSGKFRIHRDSPVAEAAMVADGNIVKCRWPWRTDYDFAFLLEKGDVVLASKKERGGEELDLGGRGVLAYLDRAVMDAVAYTTGVITSPAWTEVWTSQTVAHPSGVAFDSTDPDGIYVAGKVSRKIYRIDQVTLKKTTVSPALFSGALAGLSFDPLDSGIAWALEAPWLDGSGASTKIHKLDKSDWSIIDTYNLGAPVELTSIRSDGTYLWTPRYDNDRIQQRDISDGSVIDSSTITYNGVVQTKPNGIALHGTTLAYWFGGTSGKGTGRALLADTSDPWTITGIQRTKGVSGFGGEWTTEGGDEFLYVDNYVVGQVAKYALTSSSPVDPVDGTWRLDEGTAGAILWRIIEEALAAARPQHPFPDLTIDFNQTQDSDGDPWEAHDGTLEFDAKITASVLATALRLLPYGLIEKVTPYLLLRAFNASTYGVDRTGTDFGAGVVRFEKGVNILPDLGRQTREREQHSHMLVVGADNLYARATLDDLGYVREGGLSTDQSDVTALAGSGAAELADERVRRERIRFAIPIGDDPDNGRYLPFTHYNEGDRVTLHTGTGEHDYNNATFVLYAFSLEESKAGTWERAVVELAAATLLDEIPGSSGAGGTGGSATGGGAGSGGAIGGGQGPGSSQEPAPTFEGVDSTGAVTSSAAGRRIRSTGFQVYQDGPGSVRLVFPPEIRNLADLDDVDVAGIADGFGIKFDAATGTFIPVDLSAVGGSGGGDEVGDPEAFTAAGGTPETFTLSAAPDRVLVFVNGVLALPADVSLAGADVDVDTTAGDEVVIVPITAGTGGGGGGGGGGALTNTYVGYNAAGASFDNPVTTTRKYAKKVTLATDGLLTSIEFYAKGNGGNVFEIVGILREDSAGSPGNVIGITGNGAVDSDAASILYNLYLSTTPRWVSLPIGKWLTAGDYWIEIGVKTGGSGHFNLAYDGSGSDQTATDTLWGNDTPPWSASGNKYSLRAGVIS